MKKYRVDGARKEEKFNESFYVLSRFLSLSRDAVQEANNRYEWELICSPHK
jgi:hypothetical protein